MGRVLVMTHCVQQRCVVLALPSKALLPKHWGRSEWGISFIYFNLKMQTEAEACGASAPLGCVCSTPITLTLNNVKSLSRTSSLIFFIVIFLKFVQVCCAFRRQMFFCRLNYSLRITDYGWGGNYAVAVRKNAACPLTGERKCEWRELFLPVLSSIPPSWRSAGRERNRGLNRSKLKKKIWSERMNGKNIWKASCWVV